MVNTLLIEQSTFQIEERASFKQKALQWANEFEVVCYLDNNDYPSKHNNYECLIAVGVEEQIVKVKSGNAFNQLQEFYEEQKDWLFGFLSYDLKNEVEQLTSSNEDHIKLPALHFFRPQYIIAIKKKMVQIFSKKEDAAFIFHQIQQHKIGLAKTNKSAISINAKIDKAEYIKTVEKIREHIVAGDIYEMNYCQAFYAEDCELTPIDLFLKLNQLSKAPFAAYYKLHDKYVICSSPERFIKKQANQLISQPIKGTIARGENEEEDQLLKTKLYNSQKDRAENVMIVDLVRNDLSKSCKAGTVEVEELFGIYGFEQVNHMISIVKGTLREEVHFVDAIKNAFPMGSMTGAPKVMSMELIERYEKTKRGLYSGAIGYITPDGDFDFNVVIRSILYNASSKYLSYQVGGAIVYDSDPESEYEECLLKAKAMLAAIQS